MTTALLLGTALLTLATATVLLGLTVGLGRAASRARQARRRRLAAPARRALLALTAGDEDTAALTTELVTLDEPTWRTVEPTAIALLSKVRGEAYPILVSLLERRGLPDRAALDLRSRSAARRATAAEVLGNVGHRQSVTALTALLGDPDPDVRTVAARALGRIGDPDSALPLLRSLAGRRPVPPPTVAQAVMRFGPAAQGALETALGHEHELVRATAVELLGLVGAISSAARVERALRSDPSVEVRVRAATALGRLGPRSALPPLLSAVEPGRPAALRAAATRALGEIGATAATPALAVLLGDPEHPVAHHAAYALLRLGGAGRAVLVDAAEVAPGTASTPDTKAAPDTAATPDPARLRAAAHAREALAVAALQELRRVPPPSVLAARARTPVTPGRPGVPAHPAASTPQTASAAGARK